MRIQGQGPMRIQAPQNLHVQATPSWGVMDVPIARSCRACGIYRYVAITALRLNVLINTIVLYETELEHVKRLDNHDSQSAQFLRYELERLKRERETCCATITQLTQSL
jgi:hypothetical protein